MIINALLSLLHSVLSILTSFISIPSLPDDIKSFISKALEFMLSGLNILGNYFDLNYLLMLFGIVIAVEAGILIYKIVMWVIKKIPMLGID